MYLMDVNILVYAHREDVKNHKEYRQWLESVINSPVNYGYSSLVLSGFLRVVTHPKVFENTVKKHPQSIAVVFNDISITCSELNISKKFHL